MSLVPSVIGWYDRHSYTLKFLYTQLNPVLTYLLTDLLVTLLLYGSGYRVQSYRPCHVEYYFVTTQTNLSQLKESKTKGSKIILFTVLLKSKFRFMPVFLICFLIYVFINIVINSTVVVAQPQTRTTFSSLPWTAATMPYIMFSTWSIPAVTRWSYWNMTRMHSHSPSPTILPPCSSIGPTSITAALIATRCAPEIAPPFIKTEPVSDKFFRPGKFSKHYERCSSRYQIFDNYLRLCRDATDRN